MGTPIAALATATTCACPPHRRSTTAVDATPRGRPSRGCISTGSSTCRRSTRSSPHGRARADVNTNPSVVCGCTEPRIRKDNMYIRTCFSWWPPRRGGGGGGSGGDAVGGGRGGCVRTRSGRGGARDHGGGSCTDANQKKSDAPQEPGSDMMRFRAGRPRAGRVHLPPRGSLPARRDGCGRKGSLVGS